MGWLPTVALRQESDSLTPDTCSLSLVEPAARSYVWKGNGNVMPGGMLAVHRMRREPVAQDNGLLNKTPGSVVLEATICLDANQEGDHHATAFFGEPSRTVTRGNPAEVSRKKNDRSALPQRGLELAVDTLK